MSYAEDEGIDSYWADEISPADNIRVEEWENGFHTDREGNEIPLSEMTTSHLKNTIKFFSGLDTSALEAELERRKDFIPITPVIGREEVNRFRDEREVGQYTNDE